MIETINRKKMSIKACEDSLTGYVFEYLKHLPLEMFWELICKAAYGSQLPTSTGVLNEIEFWPHWSVKNVEESNNKNFVEPDVFIRFDKFDFIVEAKRKDDGQQYIDQWKNEIAAYHQEYGAEKKECYLFALGGINTEESETIATENGKVMVIKCRWSRLLTAIQNRQQAILSSQGVTSQDKAHLCILDDLISVFERHGFSIVKWLDDLDFKDYGFSDNDLFKQGEEDKMNTNDHQTKTKALTEVRKAYRMLFSYQSRILDLARYIGTYYHFSYNGGWPMFSRSAPNQGKGKLDFWAWDWLNMYFYQFHFGKRKVEGKELEFAVFHQVDDGYLKTYSGEVEEYVHENKLKMETYETPEKANSNMILVLGYKKWAEGHGWANDFFMNRSKTEEIVGNLSEGILICKKYPLTDFFNEESAANTLSQFSALCKKHQISFGKWKLPEREGKDNSNE